MSMDIQVTITEEEECPVLNEEDLGFLQAKRRFEAEYCRLLVERAGGNISRASRWARLNRKTFYELMHRCGFRNYNLKSKYIKKGSTQ
jgi:DNA-binding NtrC family response regulator